MFEKSRIQISYTNDFWFFSQETPLAQIPEEVSDTHSDDPNDWNCENITDNQ